MIATIGQRRTEGRERGNYPTSISVSVQENISAAGCASSTVFRLYRRTCTYKTDRALRRRLFSYRRILRALVVGTYKSISLYKISFAPAVERNIILMLIFCGAIELIGLLSRLEA